MPSEPKLIVIVGPTASGKSDLAITLARRFNGEIISADSRQVYRGMDIGTGKVTKKEQKLTRHWLLDVASPKRQYSVARFKRDTQKAIRNIVRRGKVPIICGGTGFWIDALIYGTTFPDAKPDATLRAQLRALSTEELYEKLVRLDPVRAAAIDRRNPHRLIRALEIVITTGKPVPAPITTPPPYRTLYLGITLPQEILAQRIAKRLDARLKGGMLAEVKKLHAQGISWKRLESFGLEYRWLARYLQQKISRQEMRDNLLCDIIAYAKRQMTWFRRNKQIHWIGKPTEAVRLVQQFLL